MLNKKLDGCAKEHIKIEMKSNKNLVLKFNTAAYELAKSSIVDFLESNIFQSEFAYSEEQSLDDKGVNVETRFKVVNRKADGNPRKLPKLTTNCYHTTSSMLINGSKVDFFAREGLLLLKNKLSLHCQKLDSLNAELESVMKAYQTGQQVGNQSQLMPKPAVDTDEYASEQNSSIDSVELNSTTFYCPNCDQVAGQNTIACEECELWYHYGCVGLSLADVVKINTDIPYICDNCNDNQVYGEKSTIASNQVEDLNETVIVEPRPQSNITSSLGTYHEKRKQ